MRYRSMLAVLVVAAFLITVVPMTSGGSDAYTATDGSNSAGYEVKDLTSDEVEMLVPGLRTISAKGIIDTIFVDDANNYYITDINVSEYRYSEYKGQKVDGNDVTTVVSTDAHYKITFTATRSGLPASQLLANAEKNKDILREIGMENRSQEGAVITVSAIVENIHSTLQRTTSEVNDLGFVLTETWNRVATRLTTDSDVTYKFNDGTGDKTVEFSSSNGEETSVKVKTTYDFQGIAIKDVTELSRAIVDRNISEYGRHSWDTVKFGDSEHGVDTVLIDPQTDPTYVSIAYSDANIYAGNITVGEYHLYGETGTCIFSPGGPQVPSLDSEAAIKEFISAHGSWSENDYDKAKSATDSTYKDVSIIDELTLAFTVVAVAVGVFALIFLIFIIVLIILIVKKKR